MSYSDSLDSFDKQFENFSEHEKDSLNINNDLEKKNEELKEELIAKNDLLNEINNELTNLKIKLKYLEEEKDILEFSNNKLKSKIDVLKDLMNKKVY